MKRTYEKPMLTVDSFQLNAAIAASCSSEGKIPLGYADVSCLQQNLPGIGLIFSNDCGLDVTAQEFNYGGDGNDTYCYHGPFNPNGLFMRS